MYIETLRSYRLAGIALFDLASTFVGGFLLDLIFNFPDKLTYYYSLIPLGIIVHLALGRKTFLNRQLFYSEENPNGYQLAFISYLVSYLVIYLKRN